LGCGRFVSTNHKIDEPQTEPGYFYLMWSYNREYSETERALDIFQEGVAGKPLRAAYANADPEARALSRTTLSTSSGSRPRSLHRYRVVNVILVPRTRSSSLRIDWAMFLSAIEASMAEHKQDPTDPAGPNLVRWYCNVDGTTKLIIDQVLMMISGQSLPTLVRMVEEP
jgi:hypothetical protein